jgi:hypothetical protein
MTTQEYIDKLFCYICNYGELVHKYITKLKFGEWCKDLEERIITLNYLIDEFKNFNTLDLPDFEEDYNSYTEEEFKDLMNAIEKLL